MSGENLNLSALERLAALVRDHHGREPEDMSAEELEAWLRTNGVKMEQPRERFSQLLKRVQAKRRLARASARRQQAIAQARDMLAKGEESLAAVKERIQAMIRNLGQHSPEQAAVYAREFEKATPEDLKSLEEDLLLLQGTDDDEQKTPQ